MPDNDFRCWQHFSSKSECLLLWESTSCIRHSAKTFLCRISLHSEIAVNEWNISKMTKNLQTFGHFSSLFTCPTGQQVSTSLTGATSMQVLNNKINKYDSIHLVL